MALSVSDILKKYNINVVYKNGDEIRFHCPFHNDKHPSLDFNVVKLKWICRAGCGGGDIVEFIRRMENISYSQAKSLYENNFLDIQSDEISTIRDIIKNIEGELNSNEINEDFSNIKEPLISTILKGLNDISSDNIELINDWIKIILYIKSQNISNDDCIKILNQFSNDIKDLYFI